MIKQLELEIGKEYLIFDGEAQRKQKSFRGFYIGKNELRTPWFQQLVGAEGHTFIKSGGGHLEVYCSREDNLQLLWYSDGEDGPERPAGFPVERVYVRLSELEIGYLKSRLNAWRSLKAA